MTTKLVSLLAFGLAFGGLAVGGAGFVGSDPPPMNQPEAKSHVGAGDRQATAAKSSTVPITIAGTATGPDRKPVAGATIYLIAVDGIDSRTIATVTTDEEGNYGFRGVPMPLPSITVQKGKSPAVTARLCGVAAGLAMAFHQTKVSIPERQNPSHSRRADLRFGKPVVHAGRIVDERGQPIPGVKVRLFGDAGNNATGNIPDSVVGTSTGPDGRFLLGGMPDGVVQLQLVHRDYPEHYVYAATSTYVEDVRAAAAKSTSNPRIRSKNFNSLEWLDRIFVGDINLTFARPRSIPVQIVAKATGKPVRNAIVALAQLGKVWIISRGTTDAAGKTDLRMPPGEYAIQMLMPPGGEYLQPSEKLSVTPTPGVQPLTIRLMVGCTVEIEAVDADTGFPIRHVRFEKARSTKPSAWGMIGGEPHGREEGDFHKETDKWGKLMAVISPGKWLIRPYSPFQPYEEVKPVDLKEGGNVKIKIAVREKQ